MRKSAGVIAVTLILLISAFVSVQSVQAQAAPLATLEPLQGVVQTRMSDEETWQTVTQPMQVRAGAQIRTGEAGWAVLTFFEGTFSEILANTELSIEVLELPESEGDSFNISFGLLVGDTFNTVGTIIDADSSFEISMPGMTAAVRGTTFYTRVLPTGCSVVFTEDGEVETFGVLNEDNPVMVNPGEFIVYSIDGSLDEELSPIFPTRRPAQTSIAPVTCGDGVCQANEEGVCDLDCSGELPTCGDAVCDWSQGEGLLTCPADCSSPLSITEEEFQRRMTDDAKETGAANAG